MLSFLRTSKAVASRWPATPMHVVLGNEACDADSVVSALCLARMCDAAAPGAGFVPVLSCPRKEFHLRCETVYLLNQVGITAEDCVFLDDVELAASPEAVQVTLVDHNEMRSSLAALGPSVVRIVDHHKDTGAHPHVAGDARTISFDLAANRGVGSTCTLIGREALAVGGDVLDATMATLLAGVILLDTVNLDPAFGKVTPDDEEVAGALLKTLDNPGLGESLFKELNAQKFSPAFWGSLSPFEACTVDYKQFEAGVVVFGVSSVLLPLAAFLGDDPAAAMADMAKFCEEKALQHFMVMSAVQKEGALVRQLLCFSPAVHGGAAGDALLDDIPAAVSPLEVRELPTPSPAMKLFDQGKSAASRKQLVPLVVDCLAART